MSSTVWFPNIADLSRTYRTFAVDVVNEIGPTRQTRLVRDSTTWLLELFDALQIRQTPLVGSSFGG